MQSLLTNGHLFQFQVASNFVLPNANPNGGKSVECMLVETCIIIILAYNFIMLFIYRTIALFDYADFKFY